MPFNVDLAKEACEAFRSAIIMTSDQLMQLMDCSLRTVQRRVKQWLCHTSFNHNGRYYALPDVAQFDQYGIWAHQGVCFSRFGNLKKTVVGVGCEAEQGLSAVELAHRLHVNVHGFLITAETVRDALLELDRYTDNILPSVRTICNKLNVLGFSPRKVAKSKPLKKIKQTDAIFEHLHMINAEADRSPRVLRLSIDAKAAIKVGPFSRRGRNRRREQAWDHDFAPICVLQLFGIFLPQHDHNLFFFNESRVTAILLWTVCSWLGPVSRSAMPPLTNW